MSARVFVRLFDGATQRESDGELIMLPPPPLTWKGVLSTMIMAVTKSAHEPDEQSIARARLFLLPNDTQGIVAELNARALRFGVRDNDQFAICLNGEEYTPSTSNASNAQESTSTEAAAPAPSAPAQSFQAAPAASSGPPRGTIFGASSSGSRKNKRYRSISGKMAAIKSLGDRGLISAEDRGHLKDLLLNNDSPALQEALDNYQNTGDFNAVKNLLMREMQNPSAKRGTGDWLPESLINDLSANFQTTDKDEANRSPVNAGYTASNANGYTYQTSAAKQTQASPAAASDYTTDGNAVHPVSQYQQQQQQSSNEWNSNSNEMYNQQSNQGMYQQQSSQDAYQQPNLMAQTSQGVYQQPNLMAQTSQGVYQQQPASQGMYPQRPSLVAQTSQGMYPNGSPAQINLEMRNRNGMSLARTPGASPMAQSPAAMMPTEYNQAGTPGSYAAMGYPAGYQGMNGAYYAAAASPAAYAQQQQYAAAGYGQQQMAYGMAPYGYAMQQAGYEYYAGTPGGYAFMRAGQMAGRMGGKWTTPPPMPAYPPACSPEEKKEKIARWLKKRENRNWSNKPSYPVRHNIAKNRKRGEDGRFITKKRLAEMEAEEQARIAAGLPPTKTGSDDGHDEASASEPEASALPVGVLEPNEFVGLPAPLQT